MATSRALLEDVLGKGRYDLLQSVFVPDLLVHGPLYQGATPPLRSYQDVGDDTEARFTAFPDCQHEIRDQLAEGDMVVTYSEFAGTHTGPFAGIAGSGRRIRVTGASIDTYEGGRISESWVTADTACLLQQLGTMPMTGPADPFTSPGEAPAMHSVAPWVDGPTPDGEDNKATVRLLYDAVTANELRAVRGLLSSAFVNRASAEPGREGFLDWVTAVHGVLLGATVRVDVTVAQGEWVAVRLNLSGTHAGTFLGVAPTGRPVSVDVLATWRVVDGRLLEARSLVDTVGLLHQLGAGR